uniref:tRNA_synt_1c_R1 domain-containing protein n=1 Tax=Strongyloides papillosus TaxID=174720 RepID=A0A0N5CIP9_STREA
MLDSDYKDKFTNKYFAILQKRNVRFGILGLNSYYKTKLENGNPISMGEFFELLSKCEVEPDVETFEILGDYFVKRVESLVMSNQIEKARSVISSFENERKEKLIYTLATHLQPRAKTSQEYLMNSIFEKTIINDAQLNAALEYAHSRLKEIFNEEEFSMEFEVQVQNLEQSTFSAEIIGEFVANGK